MSLFQAFRYVNDDGYDEIDEGSIEPKAGARGILASVAIGILVWLSLAVLAWFCK